MNILILKNDNDDFEKFVKEHMQRINIKTCGLYKYNKGIRWKVEVLYLQRLNLPFQNIWYGDWKKHIKEFDIAIVFDRNLNWNIVKYIKLKNPKVRVIAWYWNIVETPFPKKFQNYCEVWSFDKKDCEKYEYNWNHQFYFKDIILSCKKIKYDAVFIGIDKGRYNKVTEIEKKMNDKGLTFFKYVVHDKKSSNNGTYYSFLEYKNILDIINESKCVIDIPQDGQSGITLRVLEALFLKKKLYTTNTHIKNYNLYNKKNIFIEDIDDDSELYDFINSPFCNNEKIVENYTFENWIETFVEGKLNKNRSIN